MDWSGALWHDPGMSYTLTCIVARCDDAKAVDAILDAAMGSFRFMARRRLETPFKGLIVAYDSQAVWEDYEAHPEKYPFANEDEAYEGLNSEQVYLDLLEFSRRFPQQLFGFIDVDCFGGVCGYDGHVVRAGEALFTTATAASDGHQQVLRQLGLVTPEWYFEPFTRGYFAPGYQPPESKPRGITGSLRGQVRGTGVGALFPHLLTELVSPWRVWNLMDTWMVSHGEADVWFSLNLRGEDTLELGGRTHAPAAEAARLMEEFFEKGPKALGLDSTADLLDLQGTVVQSWRPRASPSDGPISRRP